MVASTSPRRSCPRSRSSSTGGRRSGTIGPSRSSWQSCNGRTSADRRRSTLPLASATDAGSTSSEKISATQGRTRSTTRSGKRSSPGGLGQAAHRRRDGGRPARRRHGHGLRAVRHGVRRLHGRRGHGAPEAQRRADGAPRRGGAPGRVRDTHAQGGDERGDSRLDHERRDDALPDRLLRRAAPVSGDRGRAPVRHRPGGARADPGGRGAGFPDAVVACVGGGSNAIGVFSGLRRGRDVRLVGVEAAGAASLGTGRPGVLHGSRSSILADDDGQIADAHSISAGLDYPGVGPEHAHLRDTGRAEYVPADRRGSAGRPPPPGRARRDHRRARARPTRWPGRWSSMPS